MFLPERSEFSGHTGAQKYQDTLNVPNSGLFRSVSKVGEVGFAEAADEILMSHGKANRSRADEGLRVDRSAVVEHRTVEWQVVCHMVTPTAGTRHGPPIHWPDTDRGGRIEPLTQGQYTYGIHQVPAHLAVQAECDTGEVVAESYGVHRNESPRGGLADIPLGPQVSDGVGDVQE